MRFMSSFMYFRMVICMWMSMEFDVLDVYLSFGVNILFDCFRLSKPLKHFRTTFFHSEHFVEQLSLLCNKFIIISHKHIWVLQDILKVRITLTCWHILLIQHFIDRMQLLLNLLLCFFCLPVIFFVDNVFVAVNTLFHVCFLFCFGLHLYLFPFGYRFLPAFNTIEILEPVIKIKFFFNFGESFAVGNINKLFIFFVLRALLVFWKFSEIIWQFC